MVHEVATQEGRRPLFVLLDATWSEARKMFRKSPYLDRFPVLSVSSDQLSRYQLRSAWHEHHLCTSEVASLCLALAGDTLAAELLQAWLDVFSDRYLRARQSVPPDLDGEPQRRLDSLARQAPETSNTTHRATAVGMAAGVSPA